MKYKIVRTDDYSTDRTSLLKELEDKVNKNISAGFVPCGGVCIDGDVDGQFIYQAMICHQKDEDSYWL